MLINTYEVAFGTGLDLAVGGSATHYLHLGPPVSVRFIAIVLNGAAVNSAAPVAVDFDIVGGAAIGSVTLANGTTAGQGQTFAIAPAVVVPTNAVVRATVSAAATVAAGTGTLTVLVSNG